MFAALLAKARPLVMGVLNVTPDSFSDGGRFLDPQAAIAHARQLAAEGADILDVGAELTRPYGGAVSVPLDEERARLAPILPDVVALGVPVSIDTLKAAVAAWALDQGAAIVNDVWGLQRDPDMARVVAEHGAAVIIMHNRDRADPAIDIVADVTAFFERSLDIAARAGIARERIVLDPGIGFGKTAEQSLTCIARLDAMARLRRPAHRRRFAQAFHPFGRAFRAHGTARRVDRGASSGRRERRERGPRARRGADRAGAGGRGGDQARTMSDAIFVNGLVLHAYHGVMPHEAKVGQPFKLDLMLDVDLGDASRSDMLKDTISYETLVKIGERGVLRRAAIGWSRPPPARSRTRCSIAIRKFAALASPCASRTRRSRRPSTMSA